MCGSLGGWKMRLKWVIRDICLVGPTDAVIRLATILGHFEVLKELCILNRILSIHLILLKSVDSKCQSYYGCHIHIKQIELHKCVQVYVGSAGALP